MAPKKKDAKSEKGQQKAEQKAKQKVIEDKTFGLKNKNKSKTVQKYIKGLATQATGPVKGGEGLLVATKIAEKEAKKQSAQQDALLASLFKGTENIKKIEAEVPLKAYDPKESREEQKISLYIDQREQKESCPDIQYVRDDQFDEENSTDIVCKHFLDSVEKKQYGWFWVCPNNGDACRYRHCLPLGYIIKGDVEGEDNDDEIDIEELIEQQRQALPAGGTPVTLETFTAWKAKKEQQRLDAVEAARQAEAKKTGGRGLQVLSGRDLFTYDPNLFIDDDAAVDEEDYNEDENWEETIEANRRQIEDANQAAHESSDNEKREDEVPIEKSLFLDDEDSPDDLDALDD